MPGARALEQRDSGSMLYVAAVCAVAALGGLLFGYDTAVISGAIGFLQKAMSLNPAMTGWAASSALVGCIIGVALAGVMSDRLGRKKVLVLSAMMFFISAVGTALPRNLTEFIIYRILGGVAVGAASITSPMYIAEISPSRIRGRMVSVNQLAIVFGILLVYFVNYYIARQGGEAWNVAVGWRWMFASEALPALLLFLLLLLVPESPRWLTQAGREKQAAAILTRAGGSANATRELAEIREAVSRESGSIRQLFQPGLRKVLVIGVILAVLQQVTGINVFMYYAPEIFKKLGSGTDAALLQTIVIGSANLVFTIIALWLIDRLGRKPLMILGATGMGVSMFALGCAAYLQETSLWVLVFILGYTTSFAVSLGPAVWVVLAEIFPNRVRGRAMAIATVCLWAANFVVSQTFPMLNESAWLQAHFHGAAPFWVYGGLCFVTVVFVRVFIPETKQKSLEEIEKILFPEVLSGDCPGKADRASG
jgi:sugar porter (SP) family MFS transporter